MAKRSKTPGTGAYLTRAGKDVTRVQGPNYNGQTPANIREGARIAAAATGNKSKPYVFKPSDVPSATGAKAFSKASPISLKKAQRKIKRAK